MSPRVAAKPYPEAARGLLKDTILDAVDDLIRDQGWSSTTMAEVAALAGVSRQTVYNEFGTRDALAQAYVLREAARFVEEVTDAARANRADPFLALTAAVQVFLRGAADDAMFRSIAFRDGESTLLALLTTHGAPVIEFATMHLSALVGELWPQVSVDDARLLTDVLVRLAISYAALPSAPPELTAQRIVSALGPFLLAALAGSGMQ